MALRILEIDNASSTTDMGLMTSSSNDLYPEALSGTGEEDGSVTSAIKLPQEVIELALQKYSE